MQSPKAVGCQRDIARLIRDKKADYIFSLKSLPRTRSGGNQGTLREDAELFIKEQLAVNYADTTVSCHETVEKSHGRIEVRKVTQCTDISWLQKRHNWPGLASMIMVEYASEEAGKTRQETRFYISSICASAEFMANAIRQHWGIENGLLLK